MQLIRNRLFGKTPPSKDAHKVYIVCEGAEKEPQYFGFFKGLSSNLDIIPIPPTYGTDPLKLIEEAKKNFEGELRKYGLDYTQGDSVWFVIDTDTWQEEGKIEPLRQFCTDKNKSIPEQFSEVKAYDAWRVAQSNPCFEIWLYYHIYDTPPEAEAPLYSKELKKYVNDKILGGFSIETDAVRLEDAIENAKSIASSLEGEVALYVTEVYKLGEEILPFVKSKLDKLKNKQ